MADAPPEEEPSIYRDVDWIGSSLKDLRTFPKDVKSEVGAAISAAQWGRSHRSVKILKGFGGGSVREVVVDDQSGTYRVVFTMEFPEMIYGLHSFKKKSKRGSETPKEEMERIRDRLKAAKEQHAKDFG